jgi:hypothetical protein
MSCKCKVVRIDTQPVDVNSEPVNVNNTPVNVNNTPVNVNIKPVDVSIGATQLQCATCERIFKNAWNLKCHSMKIVPCKGKPLQCYKCDREFASRVSKSVHMRRCTGKSTALIQLPNNPNNPKISDNTPVTIGTIESQTNIQTQQNNIENQQNIQTQVIINNYGEENTNYVTKEFLDKCLKQLNGRGICNLVEEVHFNKEHPENMNIRPLSLTRKAVSVKEDGEWVEKALGSIAEHLLGAYQMMLAIRTYDPDFGGNVLNDEMLSTITNNIRCFSKQMNRSDYHKTIRDIISLINSVSKVKDIPQNPQNPPHPPHPQNI